MKTMPKDPLQFELPMNKVLRLVDTASGDVLLFIGNKNKGKVTESDHITVPASIRDQISSFFKS